MHEREKKRQHEGGESILMHSKHILTLVLANSHSHSHSLAYCTVRGKAGTTVSHCAVRCCAVCVRTTAVPFGFGSPRAPAFCISRYGVRRGGDTGIALLLAVLCSTRPYYHSLVLLRFAARGQIPYRPVRSAARRRHRYCTVRGPAAIPVSYCDERYCAVRAGTIPV